ncbi:hypothetical protein LUZ60_010280 [Juncus effusus]|nr:hypothetical protein LUZ60_010280 [Juncus effusus]
MIFTTHHSPLILSALLLLSFPALLFLFPAFISHPIATKTQTETTTQTETQIRSLFSDDTDDLSLFRRAVLSSSAASARPRTQQPKIAFMFLTNSDLYFTPLWEKFFQNNTDLFNVYIHADPTVKYEKPLTGTFFNRLVPAKPTSRGSPSLISAAKRLMAAALIDDAANEYFALLSQSCVPLHSFRFVYQTLMEDRHRRSFIEILSGEPQLWDRYVARGEDVMLPEIPFDKFRIGSQFFVLSKRHARLVVRDRRLWRKFKLPCLPSSQDSCYPEEHYFPTLLHMRDPSGCRGFTLTRVNWTDSFDGHPKVYEAGEVNGELIQELRRSNDSSWSYLFARKFAPDCVGRLMDLADDVIFRD